MENIPLNVIGELAGKIWSYISANGKTSATKLKLEFGTGNSMVFLAIGWLARENKIVVEKENGEYFAMLVK